MKELRFTSIASLMLIASAQPLEIFRQPIQTIQLKDKRVLVEFISKKTPKKKKSNKKIVFDSRGRTVGSTTRTPRGDYCDGKELVPPMVSLLPRIQINNKWQDLIIETLEKRPTFWFYIPNLSSTKAKSATFRLGSTGNAPQDFAIPLKETPAIVGFQLPVNVELLQGQQYEWTFEILCNKRKPDKNPIYSGTIKRISKEREDQINEELLQVRKTGDGLRIAQVYAEYGIWTETLSELFNLRKSNNVARNEWSDLLRSMGYDESIAEESSIRKFELSQ